MAGAIPVIRVVGDVAKMIGYPVGRWVNDPRHDDPRCVEPAA